MCIYKHFLTTKFLPFAFIAAGAGRTGQHSSRNGRTASACCLTRASCKKNKGPGASAPPKAEKISFRVSALALVLQVRARRSVLEPLVQ